MKLRPLPPESQRLCDELNAPQRLRLHLEIVHDVAADLVDALNSTFPELVFNRDVVLFGAATHDLGKVVHYDELIGPGHRHEDDGPELLRKHGVSEGLARFAKSHAHWNDIEDMIVALADSIWKGKRKTRLEEAFVASIALASGCPGWQVTLQLDEIIEPIVAGADGRLAWQRSQDQG